MRNITNFCHGHLFGKRQRLQILPWPPVGKKKDYTFSEFSNLQYFQDHGEGAQEDLEGGDEQEKGTEGTQAGGDEHEEGTEGELAGGGEHEEDSEGLGACSSNTSL